MRSYVIDELDAGTRVECSSEVAAALNDTGLVEMQPLSGARFLAVPNGNVGAARVGDLQVEVRPKGKVGIANVLFFLGYARDPGFRPEDVAAVEDGDLLPVLAESLARHATRAIAGGVLSGYVTRDEAVRTLRGRIRIGDQITARPGVISPVEVTYDDYSVDIAENRLVRTAVKRILSGPRVPSATRRRLVVIDAALDGVGVLERGEPLPPWHPTRLNAHSHSAVRLAEVIVRHHASRVTSGGLDVASFVVPMWKVFEDFAGIALREALARFPGRTVEQYPARFDRAPRGAAATSMLVDIVHLRDGIPVAVADAKYKAASTSGQYPNADKYQMLAYCTVLGVSRAWLIYAQGSSGRVVRSVVGADVEIVEWPLDLSRTPRDILEGVEHLALTMMAAVLDPAPRLDAQLGASRTFSK